MIPVTVLAVRYLNNVSPALASALGAPKGYPSLGMLTTDCDDATYIALAEIVSPKVKALWEFALLSTVFSPP